jgi:hypothetical protein
MPNFGNYAKVYSILGMILFDKQLLTPTNITGGQSE